MLYFSYPSCLMYCLAKAEAEGAERLKCYALGELAALQAAQEEASHAVATYGTAIALAEALGEMGEQDLRLQRGKLLERLGQLDAAADDYGRVIALQEAARGGLRAAERRVQAQSRSEVAYTLLIRLLARARGSAGEAFGVAERGRSRTLVELLSRRPLRRPATLSSALMRREQELLEQLLQQEESEDLGLVSAREHARLISALDDVWRQIAAIDEACREYVELRYAPVVEPEEIARLLTVERW